MTVGNDLLAAQKSELLKLLQLTSDARLSLLDVASRCPDPLLGVVSLVLWARVLTHFESTRPDGPQLGVELYEAATAIAAILVMRDGALSLWASRPGNEQLVAAAWQNAGNGEARAALLTLHPRDPDDYRCWFAASAVALWRSCLTLAAGREQFWDVLRAEINRLPSPSQSSGKAVNQPPVSVRPSLEANSARPAKPTQTPGWPVTDESFILRSEQKLARRLHILWAFGVFVFTVPLLFALTGRAAEDEVPDWVGVVALAAGVITYVVLRLKQTR